MKNGCQEPPHTPDICDGDHGGLGYLQSTGFFQRFPKMYYSLKVKWKKVFRDLLHPPDGDPGLGGWGHLH